MREVVLLVASWYLVVHATSSGHEGDYGLLAVAGLLFGLMLARRS